MIRTFDVFQGDIGECGCDIIVNSSNTRLGLGTGVSKRISDLCGGVQYQAELRTILAEAWPEDKVDKHAEGRLPLGEAILTHAGTASSLFMGIVHVAAVDYENTAAMGESPQKYATSAKAIESCTVNLLRETQYFALENDKASISVGIPLMGSSSGKLSTHVAAESICNGIRKFFTDFLHRQQEQSLINHVVLVAYNKDDYQIAYGAMRMSRLIVKD